MSHIKLMYVYIKSPMRSTGMNDVTKRNTEAIFKSVCQQTRVHIFYKIAMKNAKQLALNFSQASANSNAFQ